MCGPESGSNLYYTSETKIRQQLGVYLSLYMYFQEECCKREYVEFVFVSAPAKMCVCQSCGVFGKDQLTSGPCLNTFTPKWRIPLMRSEIF